MPPEIPKLGIDIPEVSQVALVVEELEDGMHRFGSILGVESWAIYRFEPPALSATTYRGRVP